MTYVREEQLKNTVAEQYFGKYDCTRILGEIDFAVRAKTSKKDQTPDGFEEGYLLWAEVKNKPTDIIAMITQLVLTIGKERPFDDGKLPPPFLGCYDSEKIAFIPYDEIQFIFYQNDFNWKVAPSDSKTKEFKQVYVKVKEIIEGGDKTYLFYFIRDDKELRGFISENFVVGKTETSKIKIDKNNFIVIYNKWLKTVKPSIAVNWDLVNKSGIIDCDFYFADLISENNKTLKEKLYVVLKVKEYELDRKLEKDGFEELKTVGFKDNQSAHRQFWTKYKRPPKEEYWDYILARRDLLVPQDIRETKGSFFTPQIWVELSQRYIAEVFGENWQDEYVVWDCCAGTGNLLAGLVNKENLWASTIDKQDVDIMLDRIKNGANILKDQVFQFDFLNDDFSKLPETLGNIVTGKDENKQLLIYINPPYKRGKGVAETNWHKEEIGEAKDELFAQFLIRIYQETNCSVIANFSKLKPLQAPNFEIFRNVFMPKLEKLFVVPANTFDNVNGYFPIGFFVWNMKEKEKFGQITTDVYDKDGNLIDKKTIYCYDNRKLINDWLNKFSNNNDNDAIGFLNAKCNDFQHNNRVVLGLENILSRGDVHKTITKSNLIEMSIYFAVRKVIPADWLNDRDQFLYPADTWETDTEFQNDCLAYALFNNNISSKKGVNHWIPFREEEIDAEKSFESHFMTDFIAGKINLLPKGFLFTGKLSKTRKPIEFSAEAKAVFEAGRKLWKYYHIQEWHELNVSLYDIRENFQGRNNDGKMNKSSDDPTYNIQMPELRTALKALAKKIEPKVYEHKFLLK